MNSLPGASATSSAPNSTELMIALSQIQQLIPLLDFRPGGLTHLLPTLLTPLLPTSDATAMQGYRASVEHAFRVAGELVARVGDGSTPAGAALELAERLMREGDEGARVLRVRKKRRLLAEQEKAMEANAWGPSVPVRAKDVKADAEKKEGAEQGAVEVSAFLPSQNPANTVLATSQQNVPPPTTAQAVGKYLTALHAYLQTTVDKGLAPQTVPLKQVKARITAFAPQGFTLEVQIAQVIKAVIEASFTYCSTADDANEERELQSVEVAALTLGGVSETITSTTPSAYPIFRTLSTDLLTQTQNAVPSLTAATSADARIWTAYTPITETITRLILAAAHFQS
ncbi:hypothetical protein PSEUBRA_005628 [Kalmanozyma brasiliensis GHG001]|uniref:Uncharacterized protein n=1 Tax=Kalmanozyma brasiliensis (strain GHG001) TaxID=1365824 RepID=V5EQX8_KALBG|nr:uncharacterized protein PSEUBRA_005628 [Kalmanozyma brasiliensis GHG001]EST05353.1 hypothetical protein PSEUBRA_005628 [Kalmanozyma brasiliensis GHG001]